MKPFDGIIPQHYENQGSTLTRAKSILDIAILGTEAGSITLETEIGTGTVIETAGISGIEAVMRGETVGPTFGTTAETVATVTIGLETITARVAGTMIKTLG